MRSVVVTIVLLILVSCSGKNNESNISDSTSNKVDDQEEGIRLLESSASKGNVESMGYLGKRLYTGDRIKKDMNRGLSLMKQAADKGNEQAQYDYAAGLYFCNESATYLDTARSYCAKSYEKNVKNSKQLLALIDIDILKAKPLTDDIAYELGNNFMIVGDYNNAKAAFRRACYGLYESDSRNPESQGCMMYYKLETRH